MAAAPNASTSSSLSQSSNNAPVKAEYFSDNSASLPGLAGPRHGPVGFEPGMFKGVAFVPASDTAGQPKTSSSKPDASSKVGSF